MPSWDVHGMTVVESVFSGVTIACFESHDWTLCPCHAHQVDNPSQPNYYCHSENWVDIENLILNPKSLFH
jgi:hypothetical protein